MCALLPGAIGTGPCFIELDMPGIPAVWPSASWDRCLTRPRSRGLGACHGPAARPAVLLPVPMRHVSIISVALKLIDQHWSPSVHSALQFPVGASPFVSGRFLATGVPVVALGLYPACPSRLTCGQSIPTWFSPVPHCVTDMFHSASIRSVALGRFPVGSSRLAFGRFVSAGVRPCPHC